jgi:hypothetical protein
MNQDSRLIYLIKSVASDMPSSVDNQTPLPGILSQSLCENASSKACPNN